MHSTTSKSETMNLKDSKEVWESREKKGKRNMLYYNLKIKVHSQKLL